MNSTRGFDPRIYMNLSQDHLVAVALWFLLDEGKETSFENLVAEAYTSFPERFQLEGYPQWPNANVIGKSWVRCRTDKKWIAGSAAEGFELTPLGQQIATRSLEQLSATSKSGHEAKVARRGSRQSISSRVVLRVEKSGAYQHFSDAGVDAVTEYDFCDLLYCTLESTPETISNNFTQIRQHVETFGRGDLVGFLDSLKGKFISRFLGKRVRGGLMPQKKTAEA